MTRHKHLKQLVRERMQKTGEAYATARRQVIAQAQQPTSSFPHFPGSIAATTALRVLMHAAGTRAPHTQQPFTEAMLFGLAGGIGIGVFSFVYEKEDFASFFLAGRHRWHDLQAYLTEAAERLGAEVVIRESSGAKPADRALRELLEQHGVCTAWVDAALLPHRAMPQNLSGGAYHVITVYAVDDGAGTATIGDLTDDPVDIPLTSLAAARARIKKDKQRVLALRTRQPEPQLAGLVKQGLQACHAGLLGAGAPAQARRNFSLESLDGWADRLRNSKDASSWARAFPPGHRFWQGLTSVYDFIEHHGTGGGLCRPLFADFLSDAAAATGQKTLAELAVRYQALGTQWSELAHTALSDDVPLFREARELYAHKAELTASGPNAAAEIAATWQQLDALAAKAREAFPLSDARCAELRQNLAERVLAIHNAEVLAHEAMGKAIESLP